MRYSVPWMWWQHKQACPSTPVRALVPLHFIVLPVCDERRPLRLCGFAFSVLTAANVKFKVTSKCVPVFTGLFSSGSSSAWHIECLSLKFAFFIPLRSHRAGREIVGLPSPPQQPCSALLGLTSIRMDDSCSLICGPLVDLWWRPVALFSPPWLAERPCRL